MGFSWILVGVLIVLILIFFKFKDVKHRVFSISLILLVLFFYMTFTNVASDVNLNSVEGIVKAGELYFVWLGNAVKNVVGITSSAIHMNWEQNITGG